MLRVLSRFDQGDGLKKEGGSPKRRRSWASPWEADELAQATGVAYGIYSTARHYAMRTLYYKYRDKKYIYLSVNCAIVSLIDLLAFVNAITEKEYN